MNIRVYVRQVAVLLFGNAAAQLINLASYPILARLYSPGDFGGFALFLTAVGVLGPIACARFDMIVQSSKDWQLPAAFRQAMRMNAAVSVLSAVGTAAYGGITRQTGIDLALLVGAGVFLTGYGLTALALVVRQERFALYSQSIFARTFTTVVTQAAFWLVLPQALGLILGFCVGLAAQAALLWWAVRRIRWRRSTPAHRRAIAARYRRQVLTDVPSTLVAGLVLNVMSVLILDLYSRDEVGYYSLAFRIAILPLVLISNSLSDVFFQKASASYRRTGKFWNELRFNVTASACLSIFIFVPLALLARPIFAFALGSRWIPAADMLVLLLPMLMVRFVSATIQTAPLVIGRAKFLLAQHLGLLAAILAAYAAAKAFSLPIDRYVLLSSVMMALVYAWYLTFVSLMVKRRAS